MIINVTGVLNFLYSDKANIYRTVETIEDGITLPSRVLVAEDVPCQLDTVDTVANGDSAYQLTAQYMVYFKPDVDLKAGDELLVTSESGDQYKLYAGMPRTYVGSHKEVATSDKQYV